MCTYAEGLILRAEAKAKREGKIEGRKEEKLSIAKKLYQMGMPISKIEEVTELRIEEINQLLGLQ
jgi:predicted transposase/invertase (TIGR01784 family)